MDSSRKHCIMNQWGCRCDDDVTDVVAGLDIGGTKGTLFLANASDTNVHRSVEPTGSTTGTNETTDDPVTYYGLATQLERMLRKALVKTGEPRL